MGEFYLVSCSIEWEGENDYYFDNLKMAEERFDEEKGRKRSYDHVCIVKCTLKNGEYIPEKDTIKSWSRKG